MRYVFAEQGRYFSTRERGAVTRDEIERLLRLAPASEPLVLDFADVEMISFSFADEVVGRLLESRKAGTIGERCVVIAHAGEEVLDPLVRSLKRRELVGVVMNDGQARLIGGEEHLVATFEAAQRRNEFTTSDLAGDLGITVQACNNRLRPMLSSGLLTRTNDNRSGGRHYLYRVASSR